MQLRKYLYHLKTSSKINLKYRLQLRELIIFFTHFITINNIIYQNIT